MAVEIKEAVRKEVIGRLIYNKEDDGLRVTRLATKRREEELRK